MTGYYIQTRDGVRTITALRLRALADGAKRLGVAYCRQAAAMGIDHSTFNGYYTGRHTPPLDVLRQMCRYYRVSADWLLGLE